MRGRPKTFDREEVLQKALMLFWRQGYEATGMADLTREMGIGRQSLYDTFGDKHALFLAALQHYSNEQIGHFQGILEQPGSTFENIRELFRTWKSMSQDDDRPCGCLVGNSAAELGTLDQQVADLTRRQMERMENAFCAALERGQRAGSIAATIDPRSTARLFISASQGLALQTKIGVGEDAIDNVFEILEAMIAPAEA